MPKKRCPVLLICHECGELDSSQAYCMGGDCAWWNEDFECCGLIAQGVIWGLEVSRRESHEGQEH